MWFVFDKYCIFAKNSVYLLSLLLHLVNHVPPMKRYSKHIPFTGVRVLICLRIHISQEVGDIDQAVTFVTRQKNVPDEWWRSEWMVVFLALAGKWSSVSGHREASNGKETEPIPWSSLRRTRLRLKKRSSVEFYAWSSSSTEKSFFMYLMRREHRCKNSAISSTIWTFRRCDTAGNVHFWDFFIVAWEENRHGRKWASNEWASKNHLCPLAG